MTFDGHFGQYGGRFVPEALIPALEELTAAFEAAKSDPEFQNELAHLHKTYSGRPSILTEAKRFSEYCGGAKILLVSDGGELHGHLGPRLERCGGPELDAGFPQRVFARTEVEGRLGGLDVQRILFAPGGNFFCTHNVRGGPPQPRTSVGSRED